MIPFTLIPFAGVEVGGFTIAETLSGLFTIVILPMLAWWVRRLILKYEDGHAETQAGQAAISEANAANYTALSKRLAEAEAIIRGDIANGVKERLTSIDAQLKAQTSTAAVVAANLKRKEDGGVSA